MEGHGGYNENREFDELLIVAEQGFEYNSVHKICARTK